MKTNSRPEGRRKKPASGARKATPASRAGVHADVGRPITDLASELRYPELVEDVREVLRTLTSSEKQISARDNHWFTVRIMPYRTVDDWIEGVVITFTEITVAKTLEAKLRAKQVDLEKHVADQTAKLGWAIDKPMAEAVERQDIRSSAQKSKSR